jgi:hypothetical protein
VNKTGRKMLRMREKGRRKQEENRKQEKQVT